MAWDNTQPTDTTKIRNLGTVIRPNWVAIEEAQSTFLPWAVNYANRDVYASSSDPSTIANTSIMYCKSDGANPEAHIRDAAGNIIQITQGGSIGSSTTALKASQITFDAAGFSVDNRNCVTAWGYFNSSGVFQHGQNMATAASPNPSTGVYNVETTAIFTTANVGVSLTTFRPGSNTPAGINLVTAPSLSGSKVIFQLETKNRAGSHTNLAFYVLIVGAV